MIIVKSFDQNTARQRKLSATTWKANTRLLCQKLTVSFPIQINAVSCGYYRLE